MPIKFEDLVGAHRIAVRHSVAVVGQVTAPALTLSTPCAGWTLLDCSPT